MSLLAAVRSAVPAPVRARLLRSRLVGPLLRAYAGGVQTRPHPHAPLAFSFEGRRNLEWAMGALDKTESEYFAFAAKLLARLAPDVAWDVGANVGLWSLFLCGFEPKISSVVAFEPDADNLRLLRRNRDQNDLGGVLNVRDVALSDRQGSAVFNGDPLTGSTGSLEGGESFIARHYGRSTRPVEVQLSTVDAEVAAGTPAPQFVKIDVEGHELSLLRGASDLLRRGRPTLLLEVSGKDREQTVGLLREAGYRLFDPATGAELESAAFEVVAVPAERVAELLP